MPGVGYDYSEDGLIEQPAIALFAELGWETCNAFHEFDHGPSPLGREDKGQVVLLPRLRAALARLNPAVDPAALDDAIAELRRDRSAMSPAEANRAVYRLLKEGVRVAPRGDQQEDEGAPVVRVIDWQAAEQNDFLLVSQFWVAGEMYTRRADLVGFVNGLPLLFGELKAAHHALREAYDHNLHDYKATIPQLFWYNALVLLSNGAESRIGSVTAGWEHFGEWKRIESEDDEAAATLETMLRGTCAKERLLDLVENFILYKEVRGGLIKVVAKNHQVLGVNAALAGVRGIREKHSQLGVFWHTQGSGKSVSMIFFAQKVLRRIPGNWTFLIITDREDLDQQIYRDEFAAAGAVTEKEAQAESADHLRQLLREDHRYVFTLIQKFRLKEGETKHPVVSPRADIIVIADEAHRSQYDTFALNMRSALPNAAFIAFTATPLMQGEEKTRAVFGDYVSVYNFQDSVQDGATVPLYYENRIPELQLTNAHLNEQIYAAIEQADLDPDQQGRLEREFAREYHLITRDERLEAVAADIVAHFCGRGFPGKALVMCIDKLTTVRMWDKVQAHWKARCDDLRARAVRATGEEREGLQAELRWMETTDMAVVVSSEQNEGETMRARGVEIAPHRYRMVHEALDVKYKDPHDPLRIVFVCAMWTVGFDAPCCSTIYLDKPLRNHGLMQAIARANRVFGEKINGLIIDYVGVFRNLQKALAIWGARPGGAPDEGDEPVADKAQLVEALRQKIAETVAFCAARGVALGTISAAGVFQRSVLLAQAADLLEVNDDTQRAYLGLAGDVASLFRAILPDPHAGEFEALAMLIRVLAARIRADLPPVDISQVLGAIEEILDGSIAAKGYVIKEPGVGYGQRLDLSQIDLEALAARFAQAQKHTEAQRLRGIIGRTLLSMLRQNPARADFQERFQRMIDAYNAGSANVEEFFARLVAFARDLNTEEQRHVSERLSEEELAVFDILLREGPELADAERKQVKALARELLETLKREKLVLDWRKRQQARAAVRLAIEQQLDRLLPERYSQEAYARHCEAVYQHVYERYWDAGRSVYGGVA